MGPGYYESINFHNERLRIKNIINNSSSPKGKGFGSQTKTDERYAYINHSQCSRMKSPGTYDTVNIPRKKNFGKKNAYISESKRFNQIADDTPGPGAYIDQELSTSDKEGSLIRNLSNKNLETTQISKTQMSPAEKSQTINS